MNACTKQVISRVAFITLAFALLLPLVGGQIAYRKDEIWVCPVSAATRTRVTWFGIFDHEERETTALEQWIQSREPFFQPQWQHVSTTSYMLLGRSYACGKAPEIYDLRPIIDEMMTRCSDEKIGGLIQILRQGSRDEQRQAIRKMVADSFDAQ